MGGEFSCSNRRGAVQECKECLKGHDTQLGKVEKDGVHERCRVCLDCGKRFLYQHDILFKVIRKTGKHYPECPPEISPYSLAVLAASPSLFPSNSYDEEEPDIR